MMMMMTTYHSNTMSNYFHSTPQQRLDYWNEYMENLHAFFTDLDIMPLMDGRAFYHLLREMDLIELQISLLEQELQSVIETHNHKSRMNYEHAHEA
jgi:hypothetical protein